MTRYKPKAEGKYETRILRCWTLQKGHCAKFQCRAAYQLRPNIEIKRDQAVISDRLLQKGAANRRWPA